MGQDINQVILKGRLTKDPDLYDVGDSHKVSLSVVTNRSFKKGDEWKEEPTFHNVELWDSAALNVKENFHKGDMILITGSNKVDSWETAEGEKRYKYYVRANNFNKIVNTYAKKADVVTEETDSKEPVDATVDNNIPF